MYTKKQLAERFKVNGTLLTMNPIRETLKACGLSNTAQTYTEEEVEKFAVARRMIDSEDKTYEQVAAHFMPNARAANAKAEAPTFCPAFKHPPKGKTNRSLYPKVGFQSNHSSH